MLTVKFKETTELAYNGVDRRTYQKDRPHTARSGYENSLFRHMIERGRAEIYEESEPKAKVTKVAPPQETKAKKGRPKK